MFALNQFMMRSPTEQKRPKLGFVTTAFSKDAAIPVENDFVAMSRHDYNVWGCVTGRGQYAGSTFTGRKENESPLRVYKTPINWLLANCEGVLPLSKSFSCHEEKRHGTAVIQA